MATERVDTAVETMARLAGILEAEGVEVLGYEEASCCLNPRISVGDMSDRVWDVLEKAGYKILRFHQTRDMPDKERGRHGETYLTFEFEIS